MPLYFFDTSDGLTFAADDVGGEFVGIKQAKAEAACTLAEMAKDGIPCFDRGTMFVAVRDDNGKALLRASLSFDVTVFAAPASSH